MILSFGVDFDGVSCVRVRNSRERDKWRCEDCHLRIN